MAHTREGRTTNTTPPAAAGLRNRPRPPDSPEKRRRRRDDRGKGRRGDPTLGRPNHAIVPPITTKPIGSPVLGPTVTTPTAAVDSAGHTKSERADLVAISQGKGEKTAKDVLLDKQRRAGLLPPEVREAPKPGLPPGGRGDRPIGIIAPRPGPAPGPRPFPIQPGFNPRIDIGKVKPGRRGKRDFPRIDIGNGRPVGGPFVPPKKLPNKPKRDTFRKSIRSI